MKEIIICYRGQGRTQDISAGGGGNWGKIFATLAFISPEHTVLYANNIWFGFLGSILISSEGGPLGVK